jgi:hypothetical protein
VVIRAVWQPRVPIEAQNGGRRIKGNQGSAHPHWRVQVVVGFQRSKEQAVLADSTFTGGNVPLNHRRREGAEDVQLDLVKLLVVPFSSG